LGAGLLPVGVGDSGDAAVGASIVGAAVDGAMLYRLASFSGDSTLLAAGGGACAAAGAD
jgi:hypothetical protein